MSELQDAIAELREQYRAESLIEHLVVRQPPVTRSVNSWVDEAGEPHFSVATEEEPAAAVGMSLSGAMVGLIGGVGLTGEHHYGPHHPLRAALTGWERYCRRHHRQAPGRAPMWVDHADGPLCASLLWATVRDEFSVAFLASAYGISYPRAERILWRGVEYVVRVTEPRIVHDREACQYCRSEAS